VEETKKGKGGPSGSKKQFTGDKIWERKKGGMQVGFQPGHRIREEGIGEGAQKKKKGNTA